MQQGQPSQRISYLFTSKELDEETGLYYFGARYYDPRTSVWVSADPALGDCLPTGAPGGDKGLAGFGGVFRAQNLELYAYAQQSPLILKDPNGREAYAASRNVEFRHWPVGTHGFIVIITKDPTQFGEDSALFWDYRNTTGTIPGIENGVVFSAAILSGDQLLNVPGQSGDTNRLVATENQINDVPAFQARAKGIGFTKGLGLGPKRESGEGGLKGSSLDSALLQAFQNYKSSSALPYSFTPTAGGQARLGGKAFSSHLQQQ